MFSTPGGKIITKQMVVNTPLNLAEKIYKPSLIVLDCRGIDMILEMGWMKTHKALLDTAARVIHLDSPVHGMVALQLSLSLVAPSSVYHITV
jgi:uncharacterized ion transporter superfamily protein YfcC